MRKLGKISIGTDTLDRNNALAEAVEELQVDIKEISRKLDRQNP